MAWHRCTGNTGGSLKVRTASGQIATFETNMADVLQSVKCEIVATGGNGTPDNPNPINGYSSANITRCGVNFFDKSTVTSGRLINGAGNEVSYSGWNVSDYIPVPEGASLYLNGLTTHPNTLQDNFELFDASKTKIGFANVRTNEYPWTIPTGTKYVKFSLNDSDLNTAQFSLSNNAPYHAYNGQTYAIAFGQEVFGGVLDVTRGKLHVTHGYKALSELTWYYNASKKIFYSQSLQSELKAVAGADVYNFLCDEYNAVSVNTLYNNEPDNSIAIGYIYSDKNVNVIDNNYTDATTFKNNVTGHIAYELATPFDIDLTPEVISAIVGENNVFADCGETEVKYLEVVRN